MRTEWVIHIWGKKREGLNLTPQEKFHMDMIQSFDKSIFDKVLINIAMDDVNDKSLFDFLKNELLNIFSNIKDIDIKICQNDRFLCEYVTFRPYVWDRIGEDVRIFYSHFKGYATNVITFGDVYPKRNLLLNEYYWSYLMYRMSLDSKYINEMKNAFDVGKDVYCWSLYGKENIERNIISEDGDYHSTFFKHINDIAPDIQKYYKKDNMNLFCPGSFVWYDMKNIYEHIVSILEYISLDSETIMRVGCAPHFCEFYIWRFLEDDNIQEQSFINNMKKQFTAIDNNIYTRIYCSKKICKEYIQDFEQYIIQNKLI